MSNNIHNDPFWLDDPTILYKNIVLIPTASMTNSERLNSLTRILLLITTGMYFGGYDQYFTVLALGFLLIMILRSTQKENFRPRRGKPDSCGAESQMAYINSKYSTCQQNQFSHTNDGLHSYTHAHYKVIPVDTPTIYREIVSNQSITGSIGTGRQYHYIQPLNNTQTRLYTPMPSTNSAFMRDSMEYRNTIMSEYVDQIDRTRQYNCIDFKPGRKTF